jgi:hypothetical protein
MELLAFFVILTALGAAATFFGYDSRDFGPNRYR